MTIIESITLFGIMIMLASIPSASVVLVVVRSATLGVGNGIAVAAGIVLADLVYIMLVIQGLSVISETLGGLFMVVKYLGAAYLIWLGLSLLKTKSPTKMEANRPLNKGSLIASFLAGFTLTLGDIKAILFYVSLFPMFIDLAALQLRDVLIISLITIASVGGIKVGYALFAAKIASKAKEVKFENPARKTAGGFLVGAGCYLVTKT